MKTKQKLGIYIFYKKKSHRGGVRVLASKPIFTNMCSQTIFRNYHHLKSQSKYVRVDATTK
jgi:hypothetical protein